MPENALLATTLLSLIGAVLAITYTYRLKKRFDVTLGTKKDNTSLEHTLRGLFSGLKQNNDNLEKLQDSYSQLSKMSASSLQKVSMVRFNPFSSTGGDQSFVLAVLDFNNNGFLLTSIHSREGTRIYIKPIEFGASQHNLSDEEQQAINQAIKKGEGVNNA